MATYLDGAAVLRGVGRGSRDVRECIVKGVYGNLLEKIKKGLDV